MAEIFKLNTELVGNNYKFDPDEILESAKGKEMVSVIIIGELPDGKLWVSSSDGPGDTLLLMEHARRRVVFGE